mmetsp:Transcript_11375/g.18632  ORF Transcript_11375/g.18632 Transcript_11375/m.18632 type:complete len:201 (+) Transcript_11375:1-603(+)
MHALIRGLPGSVPVPYRWMYELVVMWLGGVIARSPVAPNHLVVQLWHILKAQRDVLEVARAVVSVDSSEEPEDVLGKHVVVIHHVALTLPGANNRHIAHHIKHLVHGRRASIAVDQMLPEIIAEQREVFVRPCDVVEASLEMAEQVPNRVAKPVHEPARGELEVQRVRVGAEEEDIPERSHGLEVVVDVGILRLTLVDSE